MGDALQSAMPKQGKICLIPMCNSLSIGPVAVKRREAPDVDDLPANCFIRTMRGEITAWPRAMEQRYGFRAEAAVGRPAHELLRTLAWDARRNEIEAELTRRQRWSGGLMHRRADGSPIMSANRWFLRDGPTVGERLVLEIHTDVAVAGTASGRQIADVLGILAHELSEPATAATNYLSACQRDAQRAWPDWRRLGQGIDNARSQAERTRDVIGRMRALGQDLRNPRPASIHGNLTATMEKIARNVDRSRYAMMAALENRSGGTDAPSLGGAMNGLVEQLKLHDDLLEIARQAHDEQTSEQLIRLAARLRSQAG